MKKLLFGLLAVALFAAPAAAVPLDLALVLDGSGSIDGGEFALQLDGYHAALTALLPTDGSVKISVLQFGAPGGGADIITTHLDSLVVSSSTDKDTVLAFFDTGGTPISQIGGNTPLAAAIDAAAALLLGNGDDDRTLIDISTDGNETQGGNPHTAADDAINAGIDQVNAIGIGDSVNLSWVPTDISDSFVVFADDFDDFGPAIRQKLQREIVPEPGTMALFGLGLGGLGLAIRRRRRAAA